MKVLFLTFLTVLLSCAAVSSFQKDENGYYILSYYSSGVKKETQDFHPDSLETGIRLFFDKDGKVLFEFHLVDGKKNGKQKEFYTNGVTRKIVQYRNDTLHGMEGIYNNRGNLIEGNYYEKGKRHADSYQLSDDGSLIRYRLFHNDTLFYERSYSDSIKGSSGMPIISCLFNKLSFNIGEKFRAKYEVVIPPECKVSLQRDLYLDEKKIESSALLLGENRLSYDSTYFRLSGNYRIELEAIVSDSSGFNETFSRTWTGIKVVGSPTK